jgi:nucleoside recognition membrane protein YjiH
MSTNVTRKKIIRNTLQIPSSRILFCIVSFLCLFLLLRQSDTVISYMNRGLLLCVRTVIPSLFPFMVLSEWMVATGCGCLLGRLCEKPMRRLFGISGAGACALVMGLICGFPIGTKTAVSLCRNKR